MQRGCLALPFGWRGFSDLSGLSCALVIDEITLNNNKKDIEGTAKRFFKGTSFSLMYGFERS